MNELLKTCLKWARISQGGRKDSRTPKERATDPDPWGSPADGPREPSGGRITVQDVTATWDKSRPLARLRHSPGPGVNYLCSMSVKLILIEILEELSEDQFKTFKWRLENGEDGKRISHRYLEGASRQETIDQMVSSFGSAGAWEKARETLEAVPRKDLAGKLMKKVPAKQAEERKKEPTAEMLKKTTEEERTKETTTNSISKMKGALVRQALTASLETLRKDQFEKFKDVLCTTPLKELVQEGDSFLDAPNTFQRDASLENLVEDLIGKFGRTYALRATATVMEKIGRRDLAKELQGELQALQVTSHGLRRKPKAGEQSQRTDEDSYCRLI
ncbi:uncharacterized protein LOC123349860 isoform X2 [Mauremys mutica]|uniref:uncharacterized protein LOC123349860 isoform X2 n=1 Tax=Mauremys mutica TaxID=74926 RepID=UPI001D15EB76|nr:uncharacterized protein LOC123349860 isoform X2 [Mauremys mutica]